MLHAANSDTQGDVPVPKLRRQVLVCVLALFALASLIWEVLQLPLYPIWEAGWETIAYAVIHCAIGDVLIGAIALLVSLVTVGRSWPNTAHARVSVTLAVTVLGVAYTVFSEWLNVSVRGKWNYSSLMPVLPLLGTGLSPLFHWIILPPSGAEPCETHITEDFIHLSGARCRRVAIL